MSHFLALLVSCASMRSPNALVILTDDQDRYMDGSDHQPKIARLLADAGATLSNGFVSTPVCCPSRSSFLTGQHIHNIPMTNNSVEGNCSGPAWNAGPEKRTLGLRMQKSGYTTFYGGKYLNRYGEPLSGGVEHVPPGWDEWLGLVGNSVYYNYTLSHNGVAERHGDDYANDYLTDVLANRSNAWIAQWGRGARAKPFFAWVAPPACHGPHEPAPQHAFAFANTSAAKAVRTPNYGPENGARGKHWLVQAEAAQWRADAERRAAFTDWEHERRLAALLSVDDLVEKLVGTLEALGELSNTWIFYTSDHGYHLGQYGLLKDKRMLYDFDVRVPCYVRGPGVPAGSTVGAIFTNIDGSTAPSRSFLLEYFGENQPIPPIGVDCPAWGPGMSCFREGNEKLQPGPFAGGLVCSCQDATNNTYACVRTLNSSSDSVFCGFDDALGFEEHYDLRSDPWQMKNTAADLPAGQAAELRAQLARLKSCKGSAACGDEF
jgi:N-acetylglucosamine-6-sulfatase